MNRLDKEVAGFKLASLPEQPVGELAEFSRKVAAEGIVLLKNENKALPLAKGEKVSVFGRIQKDYYKSGTGSGGMVNVSYVTNILDSLRAHKDVEVNEELAAIYEKWIEENPFYKGVGWATEPWCQKEMELSDEVAKNAAAVSDKAIVIIGRTAGEDQDNSNTEGSYLLTAIEEDMLAKVCSAFKSVCVVLNVGNVVDMSWMDKYEHIDSVLYVWQGGMEGGNAAVDVLTGDVNPSGKLSDTITYEISDYPSDKNFGDLIENFYEEDIYVGYRYFETFAKDKVRYPFGFGLSYTTFETNVTSAKAEGGEIKITAEVKNTGDVSGKEIVQVYFGAPQGMLGRPAKELAAFAKTKLLAPGETEALTLSFAIDSMATFDDSGKTGHKACYVLEEGEYTVYAGNDVRSAKNVFTYTNDALKVVSELTDALSPVKEFKRMKPVLSGGKYEIEYEPVPTRSYDLQKRIADNLPEEIPFTGDKGIKLKDVYENKNTLEEFIAQLSADDLCCLVRGEGMNSPKVTPGTGSCFGGVTQSLLDFGIPIACTTDGPSGIRMDSGALATSMPNGTLIACTWNLDLVEELYVLEGVELTAYKIDALLGPGINIHRHPLNGRNFEYFSEDPYLTGIMAAAISKGINKCGPTSTIKHFCCNNQEVKRNFADSVVSQRALREIYLKPFEIAIKEGGAKAIMTSYNPTNGLWNAGSYDLNTTILRGDWGYDGFVMTDWWAAMNDEGQPETAKNMKAMVRAQNDVYMVTADSQTHEDNLAESLKSGELKISELQRNAKNILTYLMNTNAFLRFVYGGEKQGESLVNKIDELSVTNEITEICPNTEYEIELTASGKFVMEFSFASNEPELSQIPVRITVDNASAASLTINGTGGKKKSVLREISLIAGVKKFVFEYSDKMATDVSFKLYK